MVGWLKNIGDKKRDCEARVCRCYCSISEKDWMIFVIMAIILALGVIGLVATSGTNTSTSVPKFIHP